MTKFYSFIFTLSFFTTSYAQVTIGSDGVPNKGSLLDLKQSSVVGENSEKGLGLPRVSLQAIDQLEPCVDTNVASKASHIGLTIYNVNDNSTTTATLKQGIYVWDGNNWQPTGLKDSQGFGPWYQVDNVSLPSRTVDTDSYLDAKAVIGGNTVINSAALSVHGGVNISGKQTVGGNSTIGSNIEAPIGAALNIQTHADADPTNGGSTSNKGFLLPRVELTDVSSLNPIITGNPTNLVKKSYRGLQVYNVGTAVDGAGVRTWDGAQWLKTVTTIPPQEVQTSVIADLQGDIDIPLAEWNRPDKAAKLNFGTLPISRDGSYALLLRFYGHVTDIDEATNTRKYLTGVASSSIYIWVYRSSQTTPSDAAELSFTMAPYGTQIGQGTGVCAFTAALTIPDAKAGETFYVKMSTNNQMKHFNLELEAKPAPSAARTSLFYWKL